MAALKALLDSPRSYWVLFGVAGTVSALGLPATCLLLGLPQGFYFVNRAGVYPLVLLVLWFSFICGLHRCCHAYAVGERLGPRAQRLQAGVVLLQGGLLGLGLLPAAHQGCIQ